MTRYPLPLHYRTALGLGGRKAPGAPVAFVWRQERRRQWLGDRARDFVITAMVLAPFLLALARG